MAACGIGQGVLDVSFGSRIITALLYIYIYIVGLYIVYIYEHLFTSTPLIVSLQNMVPLLDGPVEGGALVSSQQQLQEQEKRIEISCALAAEASRRSRILSG